MKNTVDFTYTFNNQRLTDLVASLVNSLSFSKLESTETLSIVFVDDINNINNSNFNHSDANSFYIAISEQAIYKISVESIKESDLNLNNLQAIIDKIIDIHNSKSLNNYINKQLIDSFDLINNLYDIINSSPESLLLIEKNGYIICSNNNIKNIAIERTRSIIGKNIFDLLPIEAASELANNLKRMDANIDTLEYEEKISDKYYKNTIRRVKDDNYKNEKFIVLSKDVTQIKEFETDISIRDELISNVINSTPVQVWAISLSGTFVASEGCLFEKIFGLKISKHAHIDTDLPDTDYIIDIKNAIKGEISQSINIINGYVVETRYKLVNIGKTQELVAVSIDISERYSIQKELEINKQRLQMALDASKEAVWEYDIRTDKVEFSDLVYEYLGLDKSFDLTYQKIIEWIHPEDISVINLFRSNFINANFADNTYTFRVQDQHNSEWLWLETKVKVAEKAENGKILKIVGATSNITERKKFEQIIMESESKLQSILNSGKQSIILIDNELKIQSFNHSAFELFLNNTGKYIKNGDNIINTIVFEDKSDFLGKIKQSLNGELIHYERNYVNFFAFDYWMEVNINPVKSISGEIIGAAIYLIPINDRKNIELALEESHKTLRAILDASPIGVAYSKDNQIQWINNTFEKMLLKDDNINITPKNLGLAKPDIDLIEEKTLLAIETSDPVEFEVNLKSSNGDVINGLMLIKKVDEKINSNELIIVVVDVSERRQIEMHREILIKDLLVAERRRAEALQLVEQSARLSSIGIIAGGITHEINQPLNAICVAADGMIFWNKNHGNKLPEQIVRLINRISGAAGKIDEIIQHMRSFWLDSSKAEAHPIDLHTSLDRALGLISQRIHAHEIELITNYSQQAIKITANPLQFELIINNILINSMQALDQTQKSNKSIHVKTYLENSLPIVEIIDNGIGLPDVSVETLFDPFFSTKKEKTGTGLGLAIVKMFMKTFGAEIHPYNNELGGATFKLVFPPCENS